MFVFTALLEFAFVNYASRRDSRNSKAAKSSHIYFYTGELGKELTAIRCWILSILILYLQS